MDMDLPEGSLEQLHVIGDRVLISPEEGEDRTRVGLYLPATALDAQQVQGGMIVATGPGDPVPDLTSFDDEPWKVGERQPRHRPGSATTPSSSARPRSRSPSMAGSTWSSLRRPSSS
jgi:hypothetical protein